MINDETSQLTGNAYEDSDYTVEISRVPTQTIVIVQKLTLMVEF